MKCFYHSADLDGHCSGAIVKYKYPECELIGIDYGNEFPWSSIGVGETIFMVDFSLQPYPEMRRLNVLADTLIWIEHHKSAIEQHQEWLDAGNDLILGIQEIGKGACEWTWNYLMKSEVPRCIQLLSQYDVWELSDPDSLPFQFGMRLYDTDPENQSLWKPFFEGNLCHGPILEGKTCIKFLTKQYERYCELNAQEIELDGLVCIALNLGKPFINSQAFQSVWHREKYDAMLGFCRRDNKWEVNLYTDNENIDLSVIAKNRGGGGHKKAAGFQCSELPFK